jgi:hypothetical protein
LKDSGRLLRQTLLILVTPLLFSACSYTRHFAWNMVNAHYALADWPAGSVKLQVVDARAQKTDDSDQLVRLTTTLMNEALAGARGVPGTPQTLRVEILDHEVSLRGPMWHAITRFRATLSENGGTTRTWDASGDDARWNAIGAYIDADSSSKEAYKEAVKNLVASLGTYSFTGTVPATMTQASLPSSGLTTPTAPFVSQQSPGPLRPSPSPATAPPPGGTAGLGGVPLIVNGIVYHPETGKSVDCSVLLAWKLEDRLDGVKSAAFNREVGGDRAAVTGLTPQQLTSGMAMRDACQQAAATSTSVGGRAPAATQGGGVTVPPQGATSDTATGANIGVTCAPGPCLPQGTR